MNLTAEVAGVPELVDALAAVSEVLTSSDTATAATRAVAVAGRPNIPRDTGALQASEQVTATSTGARLDYSARYALPVHILRPWLPAAIATAETDILNVYTDRAALAWSPT
jgi:hypothetical protein